MRLLNFERPLLLAPTDHPPWRNGANGMSKMIMNAYA